MIFCQHLRIMCKMYQIQNDIVVSLRLVTWNHKCFLFQTLRGFVFLMVTKSSMKRHRQTGCVEHFRFFWGAGQTSCFMSNNEGNQVVVCDVSGVNTANPDWVTTWIWSSRPWAWRNTKNVNHIDSTFLLLICCIRKITIRWTRHGFTLILVMIWHQWLEHFVWFWQKMIIRVAGLQRWLTHLKDNCEPLWYQIPTIWP